MKNTLNKKIYFFAICLIFNLFSISSNTETLKIRDLTEEDETHIIDENTFNTFALFQDQGEFHYWIKFSVLIDENGKLSELILQNSNKYPYHADYLTLKKSFEGLTKSQINELTIHKKNRKAYVGTFFFNEPVSPVVTLDSNTPDLISTFEVISEDEIEISDLAQIQEKLKQATSQFSKNIYFLPAPKFLTNTLTNKSLYESQGIKVFFKQQSEMNICYSSKNTFGRVQLIKEADYADLLKKGLITPQDILVLDRLPRDIVPVAGIVIQEESSPSSHAALLGQMMGFPVIYQKDALKKWEGYNGQFVYFEAKGSVEFCSVIKYPIVNNDTINKLLELQRPKIIDAEPKIDSSLKQITPIQELTFTDVAKIGGKASNLTRLVKNLPIENVPQAVVIPISYYRRYIQDTIALNGEKLTDYIQNQLKSIEAPNTSLIKVLEVNKNIRDVLKKSEIPVSLINEIKTSLAKFYPQKTMRLKFRSSSNVEDLKSFNGAGLYDSKGVCPADSDLSPNVKQSACDSNDKPDSIEKGLHAVWSSLYNDRAYLARRYLNINEANLAMAILVQPSIRNELANGVAILDKTDWNGEYRLRVTGFPGEDLEVVHPPAGKIPETSEIQLNYSNEITYRVLVPTTELPKSKTLLSKDEYESLYNLMTTVAKTWEGAKPSNLDFEWKLVSQNGKNKIIVKQVREVPSGEIKNINLTDDVYYIMKEDNYFESAMGENDFGLQAMKGNVQVHFNAPYLSLSDFKNNSSNIKSITLTTIDGTYELLTKDLKTKVITSPWETITSGNPGTETYQQRTNEIRIPLPNPTLPNLGISILNYEFKNHKEISANPIKNLAGDITNDYRISFYTASTDFNDTYRVSLGAVVNWNAIDYKNTDDSLVIPNPERKISDSNQIFKNDKLKISFKATTEFCCYDKTLFKTISEVSIEGLTSNKITLIDPKAAIYAPAHHNFSWQYVVDLSKLNSNDKKLQEELLKLKARYLILSATLDKPNIQVELWSDKGIVKSLGDIKLLE